MPRERHPILPTEPSAPLRHSSRKRPPSELIRFVRALAVDDARRDHDAALDAARRPAGGPDLTTIDRKDRQ